MDNKVIEPKENVAVDNFDEKFEEAMTKVGEETPEGSSAPEKTTPEGTETPDASGADPNKKAEAEGGKEPKEEDEEVPKGFSDHPKWQKLLKQRNEARELAKKAQGNLSDEDKKVLEDFKRTINTPEYIRVSMKAQGFTEEAINKKLGELGHKVETAPEDDVDFIIKDTGTDPKTITEDDRVAISNFSKIAKSIFKKMYGEALPNEIKPLKDTLGKITSRENAKETISEMENIVSNEKILDFKKDIEPELHKFMDEHAKEIEGMSSEELQGVVMDYFKDLYHRLSVERLKGGKRKEEVDKSKLNLRGLNKTIPIGSLPKKTNEFESDADAILDAYGVV